VLRLPIRRWQAFRASAKAAGIPGVSEGGRDQASTVKVPSSGKGIEANETSRLRPSVRCNRLARYGRWMFASDTWASPGMGIVTQLARRRLQAGRLSREITAERESTMPSLSSQMLLFVYGVRPPGRPEMISVDESAQGPRVTPASLRYS
jgi:hypothetical protein